MSRSSRSRKNTRTESKYKNLADESFGGWYGDDATPSELEQAAATTGSVSADFDEQKRRDRRRREKESNLNEQELNEILRGRQALREGYEKNQKQNSKVAAGTQGADQGDGKSASSWKPTEDLSEEEKVLAFITAKSSDLDLRCVSSECCICRTALPPYWDVDTTIAIRPCCRAWNCSECIDRSVTSCVCGKDLVITLAEVYSQLNVLDENSEIGKGMGLYFQAILEIGNSIYQAHCPSTAEARLEKALPLLEDAASKHYIPACRLLASWRWRGDYSQSIERNREIALALLHSVENVGDATIYFSLSQFYRGNEDKYHYIKYLRLASENGHGEARGELGRCYLSWGLKTHDEIRAFFRFAVKNSSPDCAKRYLFFMAKLYEEDGKEFLHVEYLRYAATNGHSEAAYVLAAYYRRGKFCIEKDESMARRYLEHARNLGHPAAKDVLLSIPLQLTVKADGFGFPAREIMFRVLPQGKVAKLMNALNERIRPDFDDLYADIYLTTADGTILLREDTWLDYELNEKDTLFAVPHSKLDPLRRAERFERIRKKVSAGNNQTEINADADDTNAGGRIPDSNETEAIQKNDAFKIHVDVEGFGLAETFHFKVKPSTYVSEVKRALGKIFRDKNAARDSPIQLLTVDATAKFRVAMMDDEMMIDHKLVDEARILAVHRLNAVQEGLLRMRFIEKRTIQNISSGMNEAEAFADAKAEADAMAGETLSAGETADTTCSSKFRAEIYKAQKKRRKKKKRRK